MADWVDSGEAIEYKETSAVTLKGVESLFVSIAEQANDYYQQMEEQRETITELQDNFASIHDIQSQLLLPNKRYTSTAQRNSNLRYSSMRHTNKQRSSYKSVGDGDSIDERPSYYHPRHTYGMEIEPNDIESDPGTKIRLTAIRS